MQSYNLLALNRRQLRTVANSSRLLATENQLLVDSHCQLYVVVGNSTHNDSMVLDYSQQFSKPGKWSY